MGRFFIAAQRLLDQDKLTFEALIELRNALYGPTVPPLDWRHHEQIRIAVREAGIPFLGDDPAPPPT